jgi:hypothetical protein
MKDIDKERSQILKLIVEGTIVIASDSYQQSVKVEFRQIPISVYEK